MYSSIYSSGLKLTCLVSPIEQVLQHELRKTHAKSQQHEWIEELILIEIAGKGGWLHGNTVPA